MSTTFRLRVWTRFFDSVERVWQVKTDGDVLKGEFPVWAPFTVDDEAALSRAFEIGQPCELAGHFGPLRLEWPLRIESVEPKRRYRDSSTNGLFSRFEHEHVFEETPDGCRYVDDVVFVPAMGPTKIMALLTRRLFVSRHRRAAVHLNPDQRTIGVAVLRVEGEHAE